MGHKPTRTRALPVVAVAAVGVTLVVAACSGAPAALSDPREILDAAVTHLRAARTVHFDAAVDGTLDLGGVLGAPGASGHGLGLTGTHLDGDLDLAADRAAVRFQVPALLGLEGEVRQIDSDTYVEASLASRGWHRVGPAEVPTALVRPAEWLAALTSWLDRPAALPVRLDDAPCASGTCYAIRLPFGDEELRALASAAPGFAAAWEGATVSLDLRIDRSTLVLAEAQIQIELGGTGAVTVLATFSRWDAAVDVEPPPASEIVDAPLLP